MCAEMNFKWVTEAPLNYTVWKSDPIELFTCAAMETNGGKEWMDLTCDDVLPFFCQIPVIPGNITCN